jgi:hypothetical protein
MKEIERLNAAIAMTAYVIQRHNLPQVLPTLKRLEAARDDLLRDGDPIEYAKRALERSAAVRVQPRLINQRRDAA